MANWILATSSLLGAGAVMLGAFAAHGLKGRLEPRFLNAFETAAEYQLVHSAVLLAVGILCVLQPQLGWLKVSATAFIVGILLFCGSLYLLAVTGVGPLGIITPFGGIALIFGWLALFIAVLQLSPAGH